MNKKVSYNVAGAIWVALLIWLDQWTKALAVNNLKNQNPIDVIPGVFQLHYLENRGAAFGMMQGQKWTFVVMTVLIMAGVMFLYQRITCLRR